MRYPHTLTRALAALFVAGALLAGCAPAEPAQIAPTQPTVSGSTSGESAALAPTSVGPRLIGDRLVATARAEPTYSIDLGFHVSGVVKSIPVEEGAVVNAGDVIASLDDTRALLGIEDAEAALREARAEYEQLRAEATPEQIKRAEAQVARAAAELQVTQGEVIEEDVKAAREAYESAKLNLADLIDGPDEDVIAAAQADLDRARADLDAAIARLSSDKTVAESAITIAANDLRTKQDTYSRVYWANQGQRDGDDLSVEDRDLEARLMREVEDAEEILAQRRLVYDELTKVEVSALQARRADVRAAEAELNRLLTSIDDADITRARSELAAAEARLEKLTGQRREGQIASARAELDQAEAGLAAVLADPRSEDLAAAEAQVYRAELNLKRAKLALEELKIVAPRAGTIVRMDMVVGQVAEARKSILLLADLSSWKLVTEDLSELNVVSIREGDEVKINFFALPDLSLDGVVSQIQIQGSNDRNVGVTYIATVIPKTWDPLIRWNMSATVEIIGRSMP